MSGAVPNSINSLAIRNLDGISYYTIFLKPALGKYWGRQNSRQNILHAKSAERRNLFEKLSHNYVLRLHRSTSYWFIFRVSLSAYL